MNERYVYHKLLDKRKKIKRKFQVNDPVRVANLRKTFSKGIWPVGVTFFYESTENIKDTIPSYCVHN